MSEWLKLRANDGHEFSAYEALPTGPIKGGVVIIQEIFGVNAHIRSVVERYAAQGYHAIAPALFDRVEPGVELKYEGNDFQQGIKLRMAIPDQDALMDIAAAFHHVGDTEAGAATVGFCYGGFMAWLCATRGSEAAGFSPRCTVGYYAGGIGNVAAETPKCPVMLHFGADDDHIGKDQIDAVREAHPHVTIYLYEGAGHGFSCDARASFNASASSLAFERTIEFLGNNVG